MTQTIIFHFAKPGIMSEVSCLDDFKHAVWIAQMNLYTRHKVFLSEPFLSVNEYGETVVTATIDIPDEKAKDFRFGAHLRGVASALLRIDRSKYEQVMVGKRLLFVTPVHSYTKVEPDLKC